MLPTEHRLRSRLLFAAAVRRGRRAARPTLTVHLLVETEACGPPRSGLVVSKAVGNSVVRHAVARRLRHQLQPLIARLPEGAVLVVRANPAAARATSAALGADLAAGLRRLGYP